MPQIPVFDDQVTVRAPGAAHASPEAFAAPWQALARGAEEFGNQMAAFNERYAEAKRQADAANIVAEGTRQLGELQFNASQTPDRALAMKQFDDGWAKLRDDITKPIADPLVKAHVLERLTTQASSRWIETGNAAWGLESEAQKGALENRLSTFADAAARATDDNTRAAIIDDAIGDLRGTVRGGWVKPDWAAAREEKFKSDLAGADVRRSMNTIANFGGANPGTSDLLARSNAYGELSRLIEQKPGLTPEHREVLAKMASDAAGSAATRATAMQQREDVLADRNLRRAQTHNLGLLMLRLRAGTLTDADAAAALQSDLISESGYGALIAGMDREERGRDDPVMAGQLRNAIESGRGSQEDIDHARTSGLISTATHGALSTKLGEHDRQQQNEIERGAFATLKTIFSGAAVEQSPFQIENEKPGATRLWAQVQGEWNQRVFGAKEDPIQVLNDLVPKYSTAIPRSPSWLPMPRFGSVNSLDDVTSVYAKTKTAHESGALDDANFRSQQTLLDKYLSFYREKVERETLHIPFKEPAAKKEAPLR